MFLIILSFQFLGGHGAILQNDHMQQLHVFRTSNRDETQMAEWLDQLFKGFVSAEAPSGGIVGLAVVAGVVATVLFKFAGEQFRKLMNKLFEASWQAVIALAVGSGGYVLLDSKRYAPAILGLIAVIICLWASHTGAKISDHSRFAKLPLSKYPVATLVLILLAPAYLLAHLVEAQVVSRYEEQLIEQEGRIVVGFVLPSHIPTEDPDEISTLQLEKSIFEQLYATLQDAPFTAYDNVDVLPRGISTDDFESLKREFPPDVASRRGLARGLIARYKKRSPVDIVLASYLTELGGEVPRTRYKFLVFELDWQAQKLTLRDEFRHSYVGGISEYEVRRIALLAATDFTDYMLNSYPSVDSGGAFQLPTEIDAQTTAYLIELFRTHYVEYEDYYHHADPDWSGHSLYRPAADSPDPNITLWHEAFRDDPTETGAEDRYDMQWEVGARRARDVVDSIATREAPDDR